MPRWLPLCLFGLALAAALWRAPPASTAVPSTPTENKAGSQQAEFFAEKIPASQGRVGPSTLARLPDGRLLIAWQENRSNDTAETSIRLITQDKKGEWDKVQDVTNRQLAAAGSFANLSQIDSPLLYAEGNWLHLWAVGHSLADWRGATLIHRFSSDGGRNWSTARVSSIAPALNPASLRLLPPQPLNDGGLLLAMEEGSPGTPSTLHLAATGQIRDKTRLAADQHLLPQGIRQFQPPPGSHALLALDNDELLAAGNPQGERKTLQLWLSTDGGSHWQESRIIEQADDGAADFCAPALLLANDGQIHLTYTWRQQGIKHLRFNRAWLTVAQP